jgi:hypothetical protein
MRAVVVAVLVTSCLGGQPARTKEPSEALGDQSAEVPASTRETKNWAEAARGHGAAGAFSAAELARLEERSAPGATVQADAGVR